MQFYKEKWHGDSMNIFLYLIETKKTVNYQLLSSEDFNQNRYHQAAASRSWNHKGSSFCAWPCTRVFLKTSRGWKIWWIKTCINWSIWIKVIKIWIQDFTSFFGHSECSVNLQSLKKRIQGTFSASSRSSTYPMAEEEKRGKPVFRSPAWKVRRLPKWLAWLFLNPSMKNSTFLMHVDPLIKIPTTATASSISSTTSCHI